REGVYAVGGRMPTEQELAVDFSVNRHTVRRALDSLEQEGLVSRAPGRGTTVVAPAVRAPATTRVAYMCYSEGAPGWERRRAATEKLLARFHEVCPWAEAVAVPYDHANALFSPPASGGAASEMPTVSRLTYVADYARLGLLEPLDAFDGFLDVIAALDGRLLYRTEGRDGQARFYALPVQSGSWMMAANVAMLDKLGVARPGPRWTWDDFLHTCRQVRAAGLRAASLETFDGAQFVTRFFPYFYSANGGRMLVRQDTREPCLDTPGNERFLRFLRTLYQEGLLETEKSVQAFNTGRTAFRMSVNGLWAQEQQPGRDVRGVPFPIPDASSSPYTVIRGEFLCVMSRARWSRRERDAAWELIRFLLSSEGQEIAFCEAHEAPARSDMAPMVMSTSGVERQFYEYGHYHGLATFDVPRNFETHTIIQRMMNRAMTGACEPETALEEGQEMLRAYAPSQWMQEHALDHSLVG
ncbi:MAG TPA: extracellular solute-binding protein, partial [Candidatus Brocadiia bacterium]|nr:extracellular solute-binding protein [Candidatus Brocadiia bacterium]